MCIHSFVYHALIVAYAVMIFASREVIPNYRGLWKTLIAVLISIGPVYCINLLFAEHNPNFMFLMEASPGSPLVPVWNLTGPTWYIPGCLLMIAIVFHVLYGVYWCIEKWRKDK